MKTSPMTLAVLTVFGLLIPAALAGAAPIPAIGPSDITGTVQDAAWVPEQTLPAVPGMSGSLGRQRVFAPHYIVSLREVSGVTAGAAAAMTRALGNTAGVKADSGMLLLKLDHPDKNLLARGMRIRITGYMIRGDEGGTWTTYSGIAILGRPSAEDSIRDYLEAHIEQPVSGGRMFCAYEQYGMHSVGTTDHRYLWVVCMEYALKNNSLLKGSGASLPVVLVSTRSARGSLVERHDLPEDGEGYGESIRQLFPEEYHARIFAEGAEYDRRAERLLRETEKKARDYYHPR